MIKQLENVSVKELASDLSKISLRNLGNRYSVDIDIVLNKQIEAEFNRCLHLGVVAFIKYLGQETESIELHSDLEKFDAYLRSSVVAGEIWHLLDPGSEIFDKGLLAKYADEVLFQGSEKSMYKLIFDAWEEFLKAFSFASRSLPELREFIRASYEAGNFRALSNMEDVLENMNGAISSFKQEELAISHAIKSYTEELQAYKTWAVNF
jgi:hypothetical protein